MNKTQQLLKSRDEEFDNKFGSVWNSKHSEFIRIPDGVKGNIKSFHATTISLLLNSLKEDVNKLETCNCSIGEACNVCGGKREVDFKTKVLTLLSETLFVGIMVGLIIIN